MSEPVAPLLAVQGLARHYVVSRGFLRGKAVVRALDGVSFTLTAGRTLAVVGESGCGKSTLARAVTMIESPTAGTLAVAGIDVARADRRARRRLRPLVQMVFQNPYASLNPRKKVGALLEEPLVIQGTHDAAARRERVHAMMARVGLRPEHHERYPHMFSGGQRQRVAIARALMSEPRLVVADEPVSALDVSIQAQVLNLLMDLRDQLGVAYLFISHNLDVVRQIADDVLVMYLGHGVEHAPRDALFARPGHPYTRALLAATPSLHGGRRRAARAVRGEPPSPLAPPGGCPFHTRCPYVVERCTVERPLLRPVGGTVVACHRAEDVLADPMPVH
ncbi:MAG TPA: dipeptide ABC transporter ATP-binding protein [Casimicrobiaceae bacterium]|nr:dipeptide ABC transporter ATP-binding protein [Casimicrobiaceae bacterium]